MTLDLLWQIVGGGVGGAAVSALLRNWLSLRLKGSIEHEYAVKLDELRNDFKTQILA
ncbi:hypothetical protein LJR039_007369 [Pseudorhodoferax sp. LjRoot39]|uniref:hypothetical protein n=1 Tax=Pseudorhodoferax sp. LjRoot39 TaxID=3342328 RepID=UPI003ECD0FAE